MTWLYFVVKVFLLLGLVGAGATLVRQAHARSGYLLVAAGALQLVTSCCVRGVHLAVDYSYERQMMFNGLTLLSTLVHIVVVGLVIAALVGLANALSARRKQAAPPPNVI